MIWLFCKKKNKNKTQALNLCFPAQKKPLLCFYGANEKAKKKEERGKASWARHKRKRERWARLGPSSPKNTQSVWLAAQSPGSKVRGKVSFVPSIPLVLEGAYAHPYSHINTCLHTCTCIRTHLYLLEGGSDLSLCARPTRKQCSTLGVFHNVEEPLWKHWLVA